MAHTLAKMYQEIADIYSRY